ncbi:MAG: hypothetical protein LBG65_05865 [Puniceicoccales bacterium]|jgi:hypothetical protein|nr:hypothetical protein [Puniceicoccales bacterium]
MNPAIIFLPCALLVPSLLSGGELAGSLAAQQSQAPDKTASSKSEKTKPATPAMTSLLPPPEPPFPVEKLGAHAAVVHEVQKLLKDGALEEFYTTTRKRLQERSAKDTDTWGGHNQQIIQFTRGGIRLRLVVFPLYHRPPFAQRG